ncbi:MAG: UDP-N-acetylmuramate--L-alanine ligase [Candidatus Omnitrophica bacterium]|nr:UDP-N-acetylmuramate--L-alanine ligase [Candidatus Omnitrophota bacterium]MBU4302903.1 UDP-N-acetylmuramate--L-alanine ligase [Candidatus Omnitrophota bacterium]MBU4419282.1 UDP-N-acetylmuramate--L-alanine ligase [Candidatus Omnitrophota bacterium]MBU4468151.1 UDP-N-acetylmuramate--L-alanine ligase [Candidatus Omnitrophota bacterium]
MKKYYHFIGIGGIGMSGIAHLLLKNGFRVSGSDLKENRMTQQLASEGAKIFLGHHARNITVQDVVVYSSAIGEDNCELRQAKILGISSIKRAQALAELMQQKTVVTVTGSHGKTTTTSLISCMLLEAGLCPTVAIGGILNNINANACLGSGELFVAEADESDGSFLSYEPKYSVITNIDREHLDYYHNFDNELDAFKLFIKRTQAGGCVFACSDDPNLLNIMRAYEGKRVFFGLNSPADIYAKNIVFNQLVSDFDCYFKDKFISRFHLALGGRHNISNALAVIGLGLELGIDLKQIGSSLAGYKGAGRRLEIKFQSDKYLVVDDYAHHPSEIKATLAAIVNLKVKRKIVVFQPHRYTRTQLLLDDFAKSFAQADYLIITDIYAASEQPIAGVNALRLLNKIKEFDPAKEVLYLAKEDILPHILGIIRDGDLVMTLGAGDIVGVSDALAQKLK